MTINVIELELTSNCNAACPQCVRNFYGGPKWPSLPLMSLKQSFLEETLGEILHDTSTVHLCGTYGDPCVHNEFLSIVKWLKTYKNLQLRINTNGGMKKNFWYNLGKTLSKDDRVIFGIDGLKDTNHLYRKNVDWDVLMNNVKEFIRGGGNAVWQFIVFEHNQHQVEEAEMLSKSLGFIDFYAKKTIRFVDKEHNRVERTPVIDKKTVYFIKPPTVKKYLNDGYDTYKEVNYMDEVIQCISKKYNNIYIGSDGYVLPCGWLHDRLYGYEPEKHSDHEKIFKLMEMAGGKEKANIHYTPIKEIIYGKWFEILEASWTNENRLERCAKQCGTSNKLLTDVYEKLFS